MIRLQLTHLTLLFDVADTVSAHLDPSMLGVFALSKKQIVPVCHNRVRLTETYQSHRKQAASTPAMKMRTALYS